MHIDKEFIESLSKEGITIDESSSKLFNTIVRLSEEKIKNIEDSYKDKVSGILIPIQSISNTNWVKNAVSVIIFVKTLKGDLGKMLSDKDIQILSLYVMFGLEDKTSDARKWVRSMIGIDEKQLNSTNKSFRDKGLLISNKFKPSDYSFCKELDIIYKYYNYINKSSKDSISIGLKLLK